MYYPSPITGPKPIIIEHALATLGDDLYLLKTLAEMVLHQIVDDMADIRAEVAAKDSAELGASSHRLKGSLGAVSAMPAHQACSALNRLARGGAVDSYALGLAHLEHEIDRLRLFLRDWLAETEVEGEEYEKN